MKDIKCLKGGLGHRFPQNLLISTQEEKKISSQNVSKMEDRDREREQEHLCDMKKAWSPVLF